MKQCTACETFKPITEFTRDSTRKDGLYPQCKPCKSSRQRKVYKGSPETFLQRQRTINYGLSLEQYLALYKLQDGLCASCGQPETSTYKGKVRNLAVDHCHVTGRVRGLLCAACNRALGYLGDNPERIEALLRYAKNI